MTDNELRELNQGYLLVTVGDVPGSETTPSKSLRKSKKILAVVPNDPLDAYEAAGYSDMLTDYFNPAGYFDQVFCLSPLEQNLSHRYGMDVIPVTENTFSSMLEKLGVNIIRAYDLVAGLSLIHFSEPTRQAEISYAFFCLKKKK